MGKLGGLKATILMQDSMKIESNGCNHWAIFRNLNFQWEAPISS